jgi:hypothetical protein
MSSCKNCGTCFRDKWVLERHMSRIKPCKKVNILIQNDNQSLEEKISISGEKISTSEEKISTSEEKISTSEEKISTSEEKNQSIKCEFCLNIFHCKKYKKIHQENCKLKNDPIRLLEIEKKIKINIPGSKTECRFCNKDFCRLSVLNKHIIHCKEREDYHKQLLTKSTEMQIQNIGTLNNGTMNINNGTVNNITINNFGQESLDHLQIEKTIDLLRKIRAEYDAEDVYISAGELIISFDKYIREVPENRNISIPDPKGIYANIKTTEGWEMHLIEKVLNKGFKKSANLLYDTKNSINDHNTRVFESNTNKSIFTEIKDFANKGFKHSKYGDTKSRQIKTSYKISKLKKKQEPIDF